MTTPKSEKKPTQQELSEKALRIKRENETDEVPYPTDPTPDMGMERIEHTDQAPSGAFDHAGDKPSRERSRERR